ncbi:hypothetical protein [Acinetobacter tandoii]
MKVKHWGSKSLLWLTISFSSMTMAADTATYRGMGTAKQDFPTFKTLQAGGFIAKKPEVSRYDNNDVFSIKKPLKFMGQSVVAVSDEYMSEYVGCCVSEGWGAVFSKTADLAALQQFAKKNECTLAARAKDETDYYSHSLKRRPQAEYYELSCRERDLAQY